MSFLDDFRGRLPRSLRAAFSTLDSPLAIQNYLDQLPYIGEERDRSPLNIMRDSQCHCLDGGFLAALCLWQLGHRPLLIDLVPDQGADDDHVLAVFSVDRHWGAIAKSNYVNLGYREPVHRSIRELVMTYFEHYCSVRQEKTLRGYTRPLNASRYTHLKWAWDEDGANILYQQHFYGRPAIPIITPQMAANLNKVTDRAYAAATLFTNLSQSFGNRAESD